MCRFLKGTFDSNACCIFKFFRTLDLIITVILCSSANESIISEDDRIQPQKIKTFDGVDQFSALQDELKPGPRKSVHIHRDWDRDGHAYRRGPWKIIVGHHFLPFFFTEVYNETSSWWVVENGHWRDKSLQIVQDAMDYLLGRENTIFVQYFLWMLFDSYNVGGFGKTKNARGSQTKVCK